MLIHVDGVRSGLQVGWGGTWGEEGDGLHEHILHIVQLEASQRVVELHQGVQQVGLKTRYTE